MRGISRNIGIKVIHTEAEQRKKDGTLLWRAKARNGIMRKLFGSWDSWRVGYCSRHRNQKRKD